VRTSREAPDLPGARYSSGPCGLVTADEPASARFGVHAQLPDARGELRAATALLSDALEVARPHSEELGCADELDRLELLVAGGGGAGRQHRCYEIAGMDGLLRELTGLAAGDRSPWR